MEKPPRARAVSSALTAVVSPVPNRRVTLSLSRLETMVPAVMIMEMPPE